MIDAGDYDEISKNITEANFPPTEIIVMAPQVSNTRLFKFGSDTSSDDIILEMNKEGYLPGKMGDLLHFGATRSLSGCVLVALGSVTKIDNRELVPGIDFCIGDYDRYLFLWHSDTKWLGRHRTLFLGVLNEN